MSKKTGKKNEHIMIPDTQLRDGVPYNHIVACGNYICDKRPETIVVIGDWWDLPSLNGYEKPGSAFFEGVSFARDIEFPNQVMSEFLRPILKLKSKGYRPRFVFTMGNHEYRLRRMIDSDPVRHRDIYGDHMFNLGAFEVYPFLDIVTIDGIMYSHYFCNPQSLLRGVLSGQMDNRLNKLKRSFTQGHQQAHITGSQFLPDGSRIRGLVSGAFYQHEEEYQGPQGQNYWRGVSYKHEVRDGDYDLMEVSLSYLLENWL